MQHRPSGFILLTALSMILVLAVLLTTYFVLTKNELNSNKYSANQIQGFYASEAGLNLRAELIRGTFIGYNRPSGISPLTIVPNIPCTSGNLGSGDFACANPPLTLNGREVRTYVVEPNPLGNNITIPTGEQFAGLNALEYTYNVASKAIDPASGQPESQVQMIFQSRLVPLFQFVAFYNKDLEILPSPPMTLNGRVHTNNDLYLNGAGGPLTINGRITIGGGLYRGRKNNTDCGGTVSVYSTATALLPINCAGVTTQIAQLALDNWLGRIKTSQPPLTVPQPDSLDPKVGNIFWDKADIRVIANYNTIPPQVELRRADNTLAYVISSGVKNANAMGSAVSLSDKFVNNREGKPIRMLEVDQAALMDLINSNTGLYLGGGKGLDDSSEGGLVFYFGVDAPNAYNCNGVPISGTCPTSPVTGNDLGVRIRNADKIGSTLAGAPSVKGLTIVSNQAVYIQGDFNKTNKIPASVISDTINVLSNGWDYNSEVVRNRQAGQQPAALDTEINAGFLTGTDDTNSTLTPGYNGGLENYPRFHEAWGSGHTLKYRGSFVSLSKPQRVKGAWSSQTYGPPKRDWDYDTDFNDASKLPPLAPRFVYLKQQLFARDFEQQ